MNNTSIWMIEECIMVNRTTFTDHCGRHRTLQGKPATGLIRLIHDYGVETIVPGLVIIGLGITVREIKENE